jgi:hypothetical protein
MWSDSSRELGVAPSLCLGEGIVQDGLLKSWTFTKTDESIARENAAEAAKEAAAALPETGLPIERSGLVSTYALVVALGGLMLLGGIGWARLRRPIR